MLSKDSITAPVVGTTKLQNLEDILGTFPPLRHSLYYYVLVLITLYLIAAVSIKLTEEESKYLEEPYKPLRNIGHL